MPGATPEDAPKELGPPLTRARNNYLGYFDSCVKKPSYFVFENPTSSVSPSQSYCSTMDDERVDGSGLLDSRLAEEVIESIRQRSNDPIVDLLLYVFIVETQLSDIKRL